MRPMTRCADSRDMSSRSTSLRSGRGSTVVAAIAGLELSASQAVQDHLIPLNQSGLGLHTWGNVVPSCATCNAIKLGRPWRDVVEERGGKAVIRRRKRIEDFVEHHRYAPPFDLREATADLYAEVGNVAMALIRTKIDRIRASST